MRLDPARPTSAENCRRPRPRSPAVRRYRTSDDAVGYATGFVVAGPNGSTAASSMPLVSLPRPPCRIGARRWTTAIFLVSWFPDIGSVDAQIGPS